MDCFGVFEKLLQIKPMRSLCCTFHYCQNLTQTQTAVFTLQSRYLLLGDHITRMYVNMWYHALSVCVAAVNICPVLRS